MTEMLKPEKTGVVLKMMEEIEGNKGGLIPKDKYEKCPNLV